MKLILIIKHPVLSSIKGQFIKCVTTANGKNHTEIYFPGVYQIEIHHATKKSSWVTPFYGFRNLAYFLMFPNKSIFDIGTCKKVKMSLSCF